MSTIKKFNVILRVKEIEEQKIIQTINNAKNILENINNSRKSIESQKQKNIKAIEDSSTKNIISLKSVIASYDNDLETLLKQEKIVLKAKEDAEQNLVNKRKEKKSIEKYIENLKNNLQNLEMKKEQDMLDELNIHD